MSIGKIAAFITIIVGIIAIYNFIFPSSQPQPIVITPPQPVVITPMPQPIPTATPQYLLPIDLLSIEGLESRQKVYRLGDNATVDFTVKDERKLPYNLTVYWFHNNTPLYGWSYESNYTQPFSSWYYPIPEKGGWKAQVVLKWIYQNQTYSKDMLTDFEVS